MVGFLEAAQTHQDKTPCKLEELCKALQNLDQGAFQSASWELLHLGWCSGSDLVAALEPALKQNRLSKLAFLRQCVVKTVAICRASNVLQDFVNKHGQMTSYCASRCNGLAYGPMYRTCNHSFRCTSAISACAAETISARGNWEMEKYYHDDLLMRLSS